MRLNDVCNAAIACVCIALCIMLAIGATYTRIRNDTHHR